MSDTPITDKACGWTVGHHGRIDSSDLKLSPDGPFVHSSVAREVERENAALKQRILDDNKAYGCELMDPSGTIWDHAKRLQQENAALRDAIEESEEFARKNGEACGSKIRELLAENAALRETLAIEQERSLYWRSIAGRKEAQP